jgi:hypothetical protein
MTHSDPAPDAPPKTTEDPGVGPAGASEIEKERSGMGTIFSVLALALFVGVSAFFMFNHSDSTRQSGTNLLRDPVTIPTQ